MRNLLHCAANVGIQLLNLSLLQELSLLLILNYSLLGGCEQSLQVVFFVKVYRAFVGTTHVLLLAHRLLPDSGRVVLIGLIHVVVALKLLLCVALLVF